MLHHNKRVNFLGRDNNLKLVYNMASKYIKQTLKELKAKVDKSTVIIGDFNTSIN